VSRTILSLVCLLAALGACTRDHPPAGAVEVQSADCVACHLGDSPHDDGRTACGDCHSTTAWLPALEGAHPEDRFPIARGAHSGIECVECHDPSLGSSSGGENTNCVRCHDRSRADDQHQEEPGYAWDDGNAHFCLRCHPSGRAED
jgi:hypothetical protein